MLFVGFAAFLFRQLFFLDELLSDASWAVFWAMIAATIVTGVIGLDNCRKCDTSLRTLRIMELLVFGVPAVYFMLLQYVELPAAAESGRYIPIAGPWMMLVFTYALFIPNTWRRAAGVISLMVLAPVLLAAYLQFTSPAFALATDSPHMGGFLVSYAMMMILTGVVAVTGVHTIGALRRQAFEAKQLGQYRLKERIGAGGMGEVYLGEHRLLKRPCAIKVIRPEKAGDPHVLARFEREVRSTAKLSHWNTVEIFDYGRADDGTFYYVMEYLPGHSLAQLVEGHGPLPTERAIHLLMQTCDALSEAHDHGLIHRDIKPGNIFAAHRGGVFDIAKLLDFGLAKPLTDTEEDSSLTAEGSITGSPLFMSPEQALADDQIDHRTDIYSLGAVAYYLLTGRPPFDEDKPLKVMIAHAHQDVEPPTTHQPDLSDDIERIVMRCLAKDRNERFQSAEELRQALADCHEAGLWTRQMARNWWLEYGCPKKRAMDQMALEGAVG
jgi:serine/threonine-protein kinase